MRFKVVKVGFLSPIVWDVKAKREDPLRHACIKSTAGPFEVHGIAGDKTEVEAVTLLETVLAFVLCVLLYCSSGTCSLGFNKC